MGKIADQIGAQVARLEDSTRSLSCFIGAIVNACGGTVTVNKEELKKVMEKTDWYLDVQDAESDTLVKFVFVDNTKEKKEVLLS